MVEKHPHLELPDIKDSFKKKSGRGGPLKKIDRENPNYYEEQINKLNKIKQDYLIQRSQFTNYNQELVLKIKTTQKVSDDQFRTELRRAGLETIISNPGKQVDWIVSAIDPEFLDLKKKLDKRATSEKSNFIDGIETFAEFTLDDKIGNLLKTNPIRRLEVTRLIVSLTRKEGEYGEQKLQSAITLILQLAEKYGYEVHDKLITDNLCLLLVSCNQNLMNEIAKIDIVTGIDRTPEFELEKILDSQLSDVSTGNAPPTNAHGVLIMDTGIIKIPLLEKAVDDNGIVGLPDKLTQDFRSHGTMVAGNALYGNIEIAIHSSPLNPEVQICAAKIFYEDVNGHIVPDPGKMIETIMQESLEEIISKFPKCKIINLSFGYAHRVMKNGMRQLELATLIDELSIKYKNDNIIFVIATGNITDPTFNRPFPDYLCEDIDDIKIRDPASSVYSITVGALQETMHAGIIPSNITRLGPGLDQMIKPELVEIGGGFHKPMMVVNSDHASRLFTVRVGTSFSTPIVANHLAKLMNRFPQYSRNLIKALLISSAKIPPTPPSVFPKIDYKISNTNFLRITNVYGYGKPDFEESAQSDDNHVVLKYDGSTVVNHVRYFTIFIPQDFVKVKGHTKISVTLTYDPPIRSSRAEYMGTAMEFHLFKNHSLDDVQEKYNLLDITKDEEGDDTDDGGRVPEDLKKDEIKLKPGSRARKKTAHQKGIVEFSRFKANYSQPLVLAVICQKRWEQISDGTKQDFAVVVTLQHSEEIDLYNKIRVLNQTQVQSDVKTRIKV